MDVRFLNFDVLLTVHLSIILIVDQINAQIASGIITLCRWPFGAQLHRTATYSV